MAAPYPIAYSHKSGFAMPNVGHEADTFSGPLFKIGTSGTPAHMKTSSISLAQIYATSAMTSGSQDVLKISYVQTIARSSGYIKGIRSTITSEVKTPSSCRAIYGKIDYGVSGYSHGNVSVIGGELTLRSTALIPRGSYSVFEAQLNGGGTGIHASARISMMQFTIAATAAAHMDNRGYLFTIDGVSEGNNKLVDNTGTPTATGGIRCEVGTTDIWLLYRDSEPA